MHDRDTTDDGTEYGEGESDATRGGSSRRRFLKASTAAAAGAVALGAGVSPAAARRSECSSQGSLSVGGGDFQVINNDWGTQEEGADIDMCVFANDDGSYGYEWETRSVGGSPNYPQALVGTKPWGTDTGVAEFPIRRGDVDQLEIAVDVDQSISGGEWDLAEEWWLMEQPPSQETGTHVHEVMMVLDWGGGHDHYMEERNVWTDQYGNTVDYWADYDGGGTNADFHIFRVRGGLTSGRVDLTEVVDYLSQRHGIGDDLWLSGIELGNEYWQGAQGNVTYEQFDVTINGTTYSSGSSGGSSGGGGSGGNDGGGSDGGRSPYGGSPHAVPGRIQAEDFDTGGEGTAYHDTTSGNEGGAYRSTDVDVESCDEGGYNIGWIESGEWWTYTVSADASGTHDLRARVASNDGGGSLTVEVDGSQVGSATFGGTGGWQSWTTVSLGTADLGAGEHVVRVRADDGGWNFNWIEFGSGSGTDGGSDGDGTDGGSSDGGTGDDGDTTDGSGGSDGSGSGDGSGGSSDPVATIDAGSTSVGVGERITLRVNDTSGTGRWIDSLEWEFGDGATGTGWWQSHSYGSAGTYTVALTATANTGETTTHEVTITVS
ncbi:carbohydrate-binding protein [Halomicrobium salinisoli]|uniref:carbohydrate-binding protein n=1 Tax=Halomicrobium salinisoli TaxID=2878391 RepID=UPI001CF06850|nr:carbohydrate-binding protein [Halomicrobium salinisoli]